MDSGLAFDMSYIWMRDIVFITIHGVQLTLTVCGQLVHSSAEAWLQTPMDTELWYNVTNRFNFLQINVLL